MAFPVDWSWKCELEIQNTNVDSDLSDFPVLLVRQTLPEQMYDSNGAGPALELGGDIRFSSDSAGLTRLACEIVRFERDPVPANAEIEIWVAVPTVSTSSTTSIYAWWGKVAETQPAEDATYGKEDTWDEGGASDYGMVQHMDESPAGGSPQAIDSTSFDNDGTSEGGMTFGDLVTGAFQGGIEGRCWDFDGTGDLVRVPDADSIEPVETITWSCWIEPDSVSGLQRFLCKNDGNISPYATKRFQLQGDELEFTAYNAGQNIFTDTGYNLSTNTWYHVAVVVDDDDFVRMYIQGVEEFEDLSPGQIFDDDDNDLCIGARFHSGGDDDWFNGNMDEVRIANVVRSEAWIKAEYEFMDDPNANVIEQAVQAAAAIDQEGFRWRNDDGTEITATWRQMQDFDDTVGKVTNIRLRTLLDSTGDPASQQFKLQYKKTADSTWLDVPLSTTPSDLVIEAGDTSHTDDGNSTLTTHTIDIPPYADGDLVIVNMDFWQNDTDSPTSMTFPAGPNAETFTVLETAYGDDGSGGGFEGALIALGWFIGDGASGPDTISFTSNNGSRTSTEIIVVPAGEFDPAKPLSTALDKDSDQSATPNFGAFSANSDDAGGKLVVFLAVDQDAVTTVPTGYTEWQQNDVGRASTWLGCRDAGVTASESITAAPTDWGGLAGGQSWSIYAYIIRPVPVEFVISLSSEFAPGATTAQLTAPATKTTGDFDAGRIEEAANPTSAIDITTDNYTEVEFCIQATINASEVQYDFRIEGLAAYGVTPQLTITAGQFIGMNAGALTGAAQNLTVVPGEVTFPMAALDLASKAENLTLIPGSVTISINTAGLTGIAQQLTVVPGSVTITMNASDLAAAAQPLTVVPGSVTITINAADLAAAAQPLIVVPGTATIAINAADLVAAAQPLIVVPGTATIAMNPAALVGAAQPLTVSIATIISMNAAGLTVTAQNLTVQAGALIQMLAASLAATAQPLDVVPGAATISMQIANVNLTGETLQVVPGAITISMNVGALNATAQNLNVLAAITVLMNAAGLIVTAQTLDVVTGVATITLQVANATLAGETLQVVPGGVTISMNAGALNITAQNLTVLIGVVVLLNAAGISVTAQPLDIVPGVATISMQAANINLTGETIQVVPGAVTIQANAATLTALAQQLQVIPGEMIIAMQDAQVVGTAESLQVVPGAVIVTMQEAQIVSAGEPLQVITGVTVSMQAAQLTFTAQGLKVTAFTKVIIKGINKVTGEPIVIEGVIIDR